MIATNDQRWIWVSLFLSAIVFIWVSSNIYWSDRHWKGIVKVDGMGYYAYLPALLIHQDPSYGFVERIVLHDEQLRSRYQNFITPTANGRIVNKYYAGTAVLQLPFFLLGHGLAHLSGAPTHGYAKPYYLCWHSGTIFYAILGAIGLSQVLSAYHVLAKWQAWIIIAILFATNLTYYVIGEPSMSHVFSFCIITWWGWAVLQWRDRPSNMRLMRIGFLLGLLVLLRPINLLVLLGIPFLAGDARVLRDRLLFLWQKPLRLASAIIPAILIGSLQLFLYKWQTDHWIVYAYGEEGFDFTEPHILGTLFSYRKGIFIYIPLLLFIWVFSLRLLPKLTYQVGSWWMFMFAVIFVLSSWENWGYGGGFSIRPLVDYYLFFGIMLGLLLGRPKPRWIDRTLWISLLILVTFCQIQTFQYRKNIIHYDSMTKEMYWDNFLRLHKPKTNSNKVPDKKSD